MNTVPLDQAVAMIPDGASVMVGGFMGVGTPERMIDEIVRQGKKDLTVIANDTASPNVGIGKLVRAKLLRKAIVSHIGLNPETQQQMMSGALEVEPCTEGYADRANPRCWFRSRRHPHADRRWYTR
jgi:acetate CoA/acetoacetate CoA-transferase alpha subunit